MNLPHRVLGLLTNPKGEWTIIASEPEDVASLYRTYIAILAAIPAVSILAGLALAGGRFLGAAGIITALTAAFMGYALALAVPFATAIVIEWLAPRFKSDGSMTDALKLVAYASTPIWLAGIFYVFVELSRLVVVGILYAAYLFYLGLSPVLETPLEQRVPFTVVAVLTVMVINIVLHAIVAAVHVPYYGF